MDPATGAYASVTDADTWSDYATAQVYSRATAAIEGVGFVFTAEDSYAGVDFDDCRDPATGDVADWAVEILRQLQSYSEWSPSGTGAHVIVKGTVPDGGNRSGTLEMYDRTRYFTVTGDRIPGAPTDIEQRTDELAAIHHEYLSSDEADGVIEQSVDRRVSLADVELLEKAMTAANEAKFRALWIGDTSGYRSHSEADQALCNLLAFWTGGDAQRIEALFARSGLARKKWRTWEDYRERMIRTALEDYAAFYDQPEDE